MKKKLMIVIPVVLLLVLGVGYKMVLAPKPKPAPKPKIEGALVPLGDVFTINLAGGHYARLSVSLLLAEAPPAAAPAEGTTPTLPQNDAIRSVITDELTGIDSSRLIDRPARHELLAQLLRDLKKSTDEPVKEVLFTDLAVQ